MRSAAASGRHVVHACQTLKLILALFVHISKSLLKLFVVVVCQVRRPCQIAVGRVFAIFAEFVGWKTCIEDKKCLSEQQPTMVQHVVSGHMLPNVASDFEFVSEKRLINAAFSSVGPWWRAWHRMSEAKMGCLDKNCRLYARNIRVDCREIVVHVRTVARP